MMGFILDATLILILGHQFMLYQALNGVMLYNGITFVWIMKYRLFFELLFVYFKTSEFVLNISVGNLLLLGYNNKKTKYCDIYQHLLEHFIVHPLVLCTNDNYYYTAITKHQVQIHMSCMNPCIKYTVWLY